MPHVWVQEPGARVVIVGQQPPERIRASAGDRVTVAGHVPDLAPFQATARALVAPIRYGAGVKGKILTSLAAGVPVITTTVGNEGIGLVDGEDALIADTPQRIAEQAIRILRDDALAERLGDAGRLFVAERFSEAVTRAQLRAALER
jgi:glycosyltransferase involved in cell wall biosynthesis